MSLDKDGLEIELDFNEPLDVSSGDEPDLLAVQLNLDQFKNENGKGLQESLVKYFQIPPQIATQAEADAVDVTCDATQASSQSLLGVNFLANLLLAGSLSQVWSMINGLQIVSVLPFFNAKTPGNVSFFNEFVNNLASFDFVDVNYLTLSYLYFPETEPLPF